MVLECIVHAGKDVIEPRVSLMEVSSDVPTVT
jgi:hypothetical protein